MQEGRFGNGLNMGLKTECGIYDGSEPLGMGKYLETVTDDILSIECPLDVPESPLVNSGFYFSDVLFVFLLDLFSRLPLPTDMTHLMSRINQIAGSCYSM